MAFQQRPASNETDEDLLNMQKEFLLSKASPCATVIKSSLPINPTVEDNVNSGNHPQVSEVIETSILLPIQDRKVDSNFVPQPPKIGNTLNTGSSFPKSFKRSNDTEENNGLRKHQKSIFYREICKKRDLSKKAENSSSNIPTAHTSLTKIQESTFQTPSKPVIDGSGLSTSNAVDEAHQIHIENEVKLAAMSTAEIKSYQAQLLDQIDPKILEFMHSKRKTTSKPKIEKPVDIDLQQTTKTNTPESEEPNITLPIPIEEVERNKWVNMNKVEWGKMKWMGELPEPKPVDSSSGQSARFDLEGNLMTGISNVPVHLGLNHHSSEPELPGYTLEELYRLSRSKLASQRCLALKTIGCILSRNACGLFDTALQSPLLTQLIDSGLVLLLRCSLDDDQISVISSAAQTLHSLLVCMGDEACLDESFTWLQGYWSPLLCPSDSPINSETEMDPEDSIEKLTDNQIVQRDVVFGLIRMDLLPRLRYILEIWEPHAPTVIYILEILVRLARHSTDASLQIIRCPRLIAFIKEAFLPFRWTLPATTEGKLSRVHGIPLHSALKLFRVLSTTSKNFASKICVDWKFSDQLACYLTTDPSSDALPLPEMLKLHVEACRTWRVFLHHGLAIHLFQDLLPIWMRTLKFCYSLNANDHLHIGDLYYASAVINSLNGLLINSNSDMDINCLEPMFRMVAYMSQKWFKDLTTDSSVEHTAGWSCLSSAVIFMTSFVRWTSDTNSEQFENAVEKLVAILKTFIQHGSFVTFSGQIFQFSSILKREEGEERHPASLPSLGAIEWGGNSINPSIRRGTTIPIFLAISQAILQCHSLEKDTSRPSLKGDVKETVHQLSRLFCDGLKPYLASLAQNLSEHQAVNWFSRYELRLITNIILIAGSLDICHLNDSAFYHGLSMPVISLVLVHGGFVDQISGLLSRVVFSKDFYVQHEKFELMQQNFSKLLNPTSTKCVEQGTPLLNNLSHLCVDYERLIKMFLKHEGLHSNSPAYHLFRKCVPTQKWTDVSKWLEDWTQLPLFEPLLMVKDSVRQADPQRIHRFLLWLELLLLEHSINLDHRPSGLFCRLFSIYLLGDELFLNSDVSQTLHRVLKIFLMKFLRISLDEKHIGFRFQDFYKELLTQFESVSYGDPIFAATILIPLQSAYPSRWRIEFFSDHQNVLPLLKTDVTESLVPIENYLSPPEQDDQVIELYFKLLLQGSFSRCLFLYVIAVHHLNHRLFSPEECLKPELRHIARTIFQLRHKKDCCMDVLLYRSLNTSSPKRLDFHPEIPPHLITFYE